MFRQRMATKKGSFFYDFDKKVDNFIFKTSCISICVYVGYLLGVWSMAG